MNRRILIIVTGFPASGKTRLANEISKYLNIPVISKDFIKESLFDSLGYKDREYSKKIGRASYDLMYKTIESYINNNISLITETNFDSKFSSKYFNNLIKKYNCLAVQVICNANNNVLLGRFKKRAKSDERHPGHVDKDNFIEFKEVLNGGPYKSLDIDAIVLKVNTDDFNKVNYLRISNNIKNIINNKNNDLLTNF